MRTLVAAHLLDADGLWFAAHLRVDDADPKANNIVWKPQPSFDFGETEFMRWATLAEAQRIDPRTFETEVA